MSYLPSTTAIARTLLLAGILLAVAVLATRSFIPAFAQEEADKIKYEENGTDSVAVYTATDPEGEDIIWSLLDDASKNRGGATVTDYPDYDDFSIDNGALSFESPPNYEKPQDSDLDGRNTYKVVVIIQAGDGDNSTKTYQPVEVEVTNVDESGSLTLSTAHPKVDVPIVATLTDPDGKRGATLPLMAADTNLNDETTASSVTPAINTMWRWSTSTSATGPWNDIKGEDATAHNYMPSEDDEGVFLRVTAVYRDGHGRDDPFTDDVNELEHTINAEIVNAVLPLDYSNRPPKFPDQDPDTSGDQTAQTRELPEDADAGDNVGAPVTASDKDAANQDEELFYSLEDESPSITTDPDDSGSFDIDSVTGQIKVGASTVLDYDGQQKRYVVAVRATDPGNQFATTTVTINLTDVDEDPEFGAATGDGDTNPANDANTTLKTVDEATTGTYSRFVAMYTATDQEDNNTELTWTLSGSDSNDFELHMDGDCDNVVSTGVESVSLCFKEAPDFEDPDDLGNNNVYTVRVNVRDTGRNTVFKDMTVTVDNEEEDPTLTLTNLQPQVGTQFEARHDEPDDFDGSVTWQWATSTDSGNGQLTRTRPSSSWNPIDTSDAKDDRDYTPQESDGATTTRSDLYLWLSVSYTDGFGQREVLYIGSENFIKPRDDSNDTPEFTDNNPAQSFSETKPTGSALLVATLEVEDDSDPVKNQQDGDVLTFTLGDGSDSKYFQLAVTSDTAGDTNASVEVSLVANTVLDADTKNKYTVKVKATDPSKASDEVTVTLTITDINEPPEFTSPSLTGGTHEVTYNENGSSIVETFKAEDPEGSSIDWTLGGSDENDFTISGGQLKFKNVPDHETKDNYTAMVKAGDGSTLTPTAVTVIVTVNDLEEDGSIAVDTFRAKVGAEIIADLTDDDEPISALMWQWATSTKATGPWYNIAAFDASDDSDYTPVPTDAGMFLRVTAEYTDGKG